MDRDVMRKAIGPQPFAIGPLDAPISPTAVPAMRVAARLVHDAARIQIMAFIDLAATWHKRLRDAQLGHFQSAVICERRHLWLGIPTVALSTIVGSSVFATMEKGAPPEAKWVVGCLSVLAAIMAAVQTFLRHSDRAEKHRVAGAGFGALKTELELRVQYPPAPEKEEEYVCQFVERWDRLIETSPTVHEVAFRRQKAAPPFDVSKLIPERLKSPSTAQAVVASDAGGSTVNIPQHPETLIPVSRGDG